jgi:hypothetical protein
MIKRGSTKKGIAKNGISTLCKRDTVWGGLSRTRWNR